MDESANHIVLRGSQPGAADRIRDLLARTVQDHVSDQRSDASVLDDNEMETVDSKLGALDTKLTGTDGKVGALANRIDRLDDHIGDTDDRIGLINERIGSISDRMASINGHLSGALTPLADELRLRPGHAEVEEIVAKVVCAAQAEMTTRLDSLEETVLTLAEALLRPARHTPDQRRNGDQS
jgi:hypothetical protein